MFGFGNTISISLLSGEEKKVKIDGKKIVLKGDGKLEPFILDQLDISARSITNLVTDIQDPKLKELLSDARLRQAVRSNQWQAIKNTVKNHLGEGWEAHSSNFGLGNYDTPLSIKHTKLQEWPRMYNINIYHSNTDGHMNRIKQEDEFYPVKLEVVTQKDYCQKDKQIITGYYNVKTGEIKKESVDEFIMHIKHPEKIKSWLLQP